MIFGRQEGSPSWSLMHSRYRKVFHRHVFLLIIYAMNSTDMTPFSNMLTKMKVVHVTLFSCLFNTWHTLTIHYPPRWLITLMLCKDQVLKYWILYITMKDDILEIMKWKAGKVSESRCRINVITKHLIQSRPWWSGTDMIFNGQERNPCLSLIHSRYRQVFHKTGFLTHYLSTDITAIFQHAVLDESGSCYSFLLSFQCITHSDHALSTDCFLGLLSETEKYIWPNMKQRETTPPHFFVYSHLPSAHKQILKLLIILLCKNQVL